MKYVVFDVGSTEIKYSVMDEALSVSAPGTVSMPQSGQDELLAVLHLIYEQHRAGTGASPSACPASSTPTPAFATAAGRCAFDSRARCKATCTGAVSRRMPRHDFDKKAGLSAIFYRTGALY